jgi:8-oxo-dGTP pyrophosphatase MutT (NUDIX family)
MAQADMNQVYGAIFISNRQRILCVRGRQTGKWSFPKGHPNMGESAYECAKREVYEETGVTLPLNVERIIPLKTGSYYIVRSSELSCQTRDPAEVMDIAWLGIHELQHSSVNLDINTFLREYKNIVCPPTQSFSSKYVVKNILL